MRQCGFLTSRPHRLQTNTGRELVRWCTAIGGTLGVAHERVQTLERAE